MQATAKVRYIPVSPYKMRLVIDVVRGKSVSYALGWLATLPMRRVRPVKKMIESALANAKDRLGSKADDLRISRIWVDQGPIRRYVKPGAQGRANMYRKKFCHLGVVLETVNSNK